MKGGNIMNDNMSPADVAAVVGNTDRNNGVGYPYPYPVYGGGFGGGNSGFAHFAASQHIGKQVGHEQDAFGMLVGHAAFLRLGKHLENRIEIHRLDTRHSIQSLTWHDFEELLWYTICIRVTIGTWQPKQSAVMTDATKINAPSIDADGINRDVPLP